jgi:DNA-binding transcriptional MerR regulator
MIFVSVAEAARHLGIDAKTVHRWLADAQLPLQSHPHDGRKQGVSREQVHQLARLHQRSLAPLPLEEPPAPHPDELPALPAALLALPEQLSTLQAQISTLQQQVAALTLLLQQQLYPPVSQAPPTKPSKRPPKPTPPAPRSHPAAKALRKPAHVLPRVEYGSDGHYVVICPKRGLLSFEPDTPEWVAWVAEQSSFRFVGKLGRFTAHHEGRIPKGAWRAHRQIRNHSYTLRLAPNHELTSAVLEQTAEALQAHLT